MLHLFRRGPRRERSGISASAAFRPEQALIGAGALLGLLEAAEQHGYPREVVLQGIDVPEAALRRKLARIPWNTLAAALDNVHRAGASMRELEGMGEHLAKSPHLVVQNVSNFFVRPEHLMYVGLRWVGPALFPVLAHELEYRGRHMRLRLELPASFPGSVPFFHITKGTLASVPQIIGHPKALVLAEIASHAATYDISCAPGAETGLGRLRRAARSVLSAPRVMRTFAEQEAAVRRMLEATMRSQEQFRQVLDALPDGVVIVRDDRVVYANPAVTRALGCEQGHSLHGKRWSSLAHPDDASQLRRHHDAIECRFPTASGGEATFELSAVQDITFDDRRAKLVVARDVTERKSLHNRLAVADRMASLGTLAAGIAHELNNPLALVLNNLEMAQRAGGDPADYLRAAAEGARRVRDIVKDLRIFAQPDRDPLEPISLAEVIESTVALAMGQVRAHASLRVELDPAPAVLANRGRTGQVLLNLILNALEAMPPERAASHNRITVRLLRRGDRAVIEVEDNGRGIAPELGARLFEPFFTSKDAGVGTGLGLAVAHGIVHGFGGTIDFTTQLGVGTTFRVVLPVADGATATDHRAPPAHARVGAGRVLLVDDEPALTRLLAEALRDDGFDVVTAASGDQAFALCGDDDAFDAIVCDLMMAGGSGAELHRRLEGRHRELAERMIFMTGGTFRAETREFLAAVDNLCLQKPFELEELSGAIAAVVRGRAAT